MHCWSLLSGLHCARTEAARVSLENVPEIPGLVDLDGWPASCEQCPRLLPFSYYTLDDTTGCFLLVSHKCWSRGASDVTYCLEHEQHRSPGHAHPYTKYLRVVTICGFQHILANNSLDPLLFMQFPAPNFSHRIAGNLRSQRMNVSEIRSLASILTCLLEAAVGATWSDPAARACIVALVAGVVWHHVMSLFATCACMRAHSLFVEDRLVSEMTRRCGSSRCLRMTPGGYRIWYPPKGAVHRLYPRELARLYPRKVDRLYPRPFHLSGPIIWPLARMLISFMDHGQLFQYVCMYVCNVM